MESLDWSNLVIFQIPEDNLTFILQKWVIIGEVAIDSHAILPTVAVIPIFFKFPASDDVTVNSN